MIKSSGQSPSAYWDLSFCQPVSRLVSLLLYLYTCLSLIVSVCVLYCHSVCLSCLLAGSSSINLQAQRPCVRCLCVHVYFGYQLD